MFRFSLVEFSIRRPKWVVWVTVVMSSEVRFGDG